VALLKNVSAVVTGADGGMGNHSAGFFYCKEQIYHSAVEYFQQFCRKTSDVISGKAHSEFASNAP